MKIRGLCLRYFNKTLVTDSTYDIIQFLLITKQLSIKKRPMDLLAHKVFCKTIDGDFDVTSSKDGNPFDPSYRGYPTSD